MMHSVARFEILIFMEDVAQLIEWVIYYSDGRWIDRYIKVLGYRSKYCKNVCVIG